MARTRNDSAPLELDGLIGEAHFVERHELVVPLPLDVVWSAALDVTEREVRVLRPLVSLRALLSRARRGAGAADRTVLDMFEDDGFLVVRRDEQADRSATVLTCAAGRFWSMRNDAAVVFRGLDDWRGFTQGDHVKVAASLVATEVEGGTRLVTETRVVGTDEQARRTFGRYWIIIRGPSGLIRRSWLAAIGRRAAAMQADPAGR